MGCVAVGVFGLVSKPWTEQDEQFDGDFHPDLPTDHDVVARAQDAVAALRPAYVFGFMARMISKNVMPLHHLRLFELHWPVLFRQ